jgi:hypothetical protein
VDSTGHTAPEESVIGVMGDAWIRQPTQPPRESEIIKKLLSRVSRGLYSPDSPLGSGKQLSRVTRGFDSHTAP